MTRRYGPRHTCTGLDLPASASPEAAAVLLDRKRLAARYAVRTQDGLAKELGIGRDSLRRILRAHGIPIRRWGGRHGNNGYYRDMVRLASWRAYRSLDRCPPDCPHERRCFDVEECILEAGLWAAELPQDNENGVD